MPWIDNKEKSFYQEPLYFAYDGYSVDFLIKKKNAHSRDRELFLQYQKKFGKDDRAFGKVMRDASAEEMKLYRGCCFALSIISSEPLGDSRDLEASKELSPYIDNAFVAVDLDWVSRHCVIFGT